MGFDERSADARRRALDRHAPRLLRPGARPLLKPDDLVELEVPELGTLANRIGDANIPARIEDLMPTAADAVEAAPAAG
jgi:hypothetical protein